MADKDFQRMGSPRRPGETLDARRMALRDIDDRFKVGDSVRHLKYLMTKVTEDEVTADTVGAACGCVAQINSTLKVAIMAAKFLSNG